MKTYRGQRKQDLIDQVFPAFLSKNQHVRNLSYLEEKTTFIDILYKNGKPANCHGRLRGQYCERR